MNRTSRAEGVALMLGSALSNQSGAALGAMAFPTIGPIGVVAIRQWVAGTVLSILARPRLRRFSRRQWLPVAGLAAVFALMNLSVYVAIDRIGLGLAVTLEFLGPLTVALVGALLATRAGPQRWAIVGCAILAAAGVAILTRPQPSADYVGIAIGLFGALCWGGYILINRVVGQRIVGVEGTAAAGMLSAIVYLPVGIFALAVRPPTLGALILGTAAGVLSSVLPFVADLLALRRVPTYFFGILMSMNPVLAAGIGAAVLAERLGPSDWLAIGIIVAANVGVIYTVQSHSPRC
jgi:inner membrane transporter RhtA